MASPALHHGALIKPAALDAAELGNVSIRLALGGLKMGLARDAATDSDCAAENDFVDCVRTKFCGPDFLLRHGILRRKGDGNVPAEK
jgi:hypothetical protein